MGMRRRSRRRGLIAGAAVGHHMAKKSDAHGRNRRPTTTRKSRRSTRRLRQTRPTRSNTSHSCTPRVR